jgi:SdpC family antimicrobial peptide
MKNYHPIRRMALIVSIFAFVVALTFLACTKGVNSGSSTPSTNYGSKELFKGLLFASGSIAEQIPELRDAREIVLGLNRNKESLEQVEKIQNKITNFIEEKYPGYIDQFKTEILSKDPVRIEQAMSKAADMVLKSFVLYDFSTQYDVNQAKTIIALALNKNQSKFNQFIQDIKSGNLDPDQLDSRAQEIFGKSYSDLKKITSNNKSSAVGPDCIVINIIVAVNVGVYLNAAAAVNGAVAVNAAAFVNVAAAVNFWVAVNHDASTQQRTRLGNETFIAHIASNL